MIKAHIKRHLKARMTIAEASGAGQPALGGAARVSSVRRGAAVLTAVLSAVAATVFIPAAAHAGGTPGAECPSRELVEVPAPGNPEFSSGPVRVEGGFYAHTVSYWPPPTAVLCRTEADPVRPPVEPGSEGCPAGALPLRVPNVIPSDADEPGTVRWGTYLPAGWYTLGHAPSYAAVVTDPVPADPVPADPVPADPGAVTVVVAVDGVLMDEVVMGADEDGTVWTTLCWRPEPPAAA